MNSVKERLNTPLNDSEEDSRICRAITQASVLIDQELEPYTTVPLNPVPQVIEDCANDWAAGIVRNEVTNPSSQDSSPNVFIERAKETLCRYLALKWEAPCPFAAAAEGMTFSGKIASSRYKTDEMKDQWDE